MKKEDFIKGIKSLSIEKRYLVTNELQKAMNAINSAECLLFDTPLDSCNFSEINDKPGLWSNLYAMRNLFVPDSIKVLEIDPESLVEFIN